MTPFDFDHLRELTREATESLHTRRGGPSEITRFDRGLVHGHLEDHAWDALLDELRRFQDCRVRTARPSHRRVIGSLVSFAKRVFFRMVRPLMHEAFETQARFNECTFELLSHLVEERRWMRAELARLRGSERPE